MRDQPTGQMVRCSKARAMFAMRACRKSVMIGMPLTKGQMTAVSAKLFPVLQVGHALGC
jgi:DNA mismatch repair protein PMS2